MMRTIDRVVAYGCSWTVGSELMDHIHMNVSFDECNAIKKTYLATDKPYENMHKFIEKYDIGNKSLIELNHRNSWAGQLAQRLNKPIINRAAGGSSLDQNYFALYSDYINGKILDTDLVVVGLTTPYRSVKFGHRSVVSSIQLGHQLREGKHEDKSLIELFNDDFLVFTYFKTLQLLGSLADKINIRLQPMIPEINPHCNEPFMFHLKHTRPYATSIWDGLKDVFLLANEHLREYIVNGKPIRCGFMHDPVESHIELANKIHNQVQF